MRSTYSTRLQDLLKRVRPRLAIRHHFQFRNCFEAVAGYVNGNIFVSCGNFGLALRLPSEILAQLFREADASRLKYFAKGHVKREYAVIPERTIGDQSRFKELVDKSVEFALAARR